MIRKWDKVMNFAIKIIVYVCLLFLISCTPEASRTPLEFWLLGNVATDQIETLSGTASTSSAETPLSGLTYTGNPYTYTQNAAITPNTPSVTGTITSCSASPALPAGLTINNATCSISGTPTITQVSTA